MTRTLFNSESRRAGRATCVAAGLLLSLTSGCVTQERSGGGAASHHAQAAAASNAPRRVQVSNAGAEPSVAGTEDGSAYVAWVAHGQNKEAD
ncbi:MAG TPA: hypothetical protein VF521_06620, partial [Pyrinomonadaceae bacterium]